MLGNQARLAPRFIVLAEPLHVLSDGFVDAGAATLSHMLRQLIQLLFQFRLNMDFDGLGETCSTLL